MHHRSIAQIHITRQSQRHVAAPVGRQAHPTPGRVAAADPQDLEPSRRLRDVRLVVPGLIGQSSQNLGEDEWAVLAGFLPIGNGGHPLDLVASRPSRPIPRTHDPLNPCYKFGRRLPQSVIR